MPGRWRMASVAIFRSFATFCAILSIRLSLSQPQGVVWYYFLLFIAEMNMRIKIQSIIRTTENSKDETPSNIRYVTSFKKFRILGVISYTSHNTKRFFVILKRGVYRFKQYNRIEILINIFCYPFYRIDVEISQSIA